MLVRSTLALVRGNYLSYPSFKEVRILIHLTCLKCLRVSKGTVKKNFYFSNLILLTYSLSLSKAYFYYLSNLKSGFFLNLLSS